MSLQELEPFIRKHLLASDRTKTSAKAIRRLLLQDKKATYELNWIGHNKVIVDEFITELSNQLDSEPNSDEDLHPSPPRKSSSSSSSSSKNHVVHHHCPPPQAPRPRPRSDSNASSLSSSYTIASSQSQGALRNKRSPSPTASVFSISSDITTSSTSFLNTSKLPLASFSPEQLADRLRLPPLTYREQVKADNLETIFTSDSFHQATSLASQSIPKAGGGGGMKVVAEVDESYPTWETGSPKNDDEEDEDVDFEERLDELGEMMQIAQKGGSRRAMKNLTAVHAAGGGGGGAGVSPSKNYPRSSSVEVQEEEGTKKRAYSSDLPLASTKRQRRERPRALPESSMVHGGEEGETDELEYVEEGKGFRKPHSLSNALQEVVGASRLSRPECVKRIWGYIKENSLQKPSDKRYIMCDDKLFALFGVPEIYMTTMNVILSKSSFVPLSSHSQTPKQNVRSIELTSRSVPLLPSIPA